MYLQKKNFLPEFAGAGMAIIFGMSFMFSKMALENHSPVELISFRFLLAFAVMSVLIFFKVIKVNFKGKSMLNLFYLSLAQPILYFLFESYGIKYSSSSQAGIMVALIPIFVAAFGFVFLSEKASLTEVLFILLSIFGVGYIAYSKASDASSSPLGIAYLMGAVLTATAFNIISRKISSEFTSVERTYSMMFFGAATFNIINIFIHIKNQTMMNYFQPLNDPTFLLALLYLGTLSSIVAFFLANYSLTYLEASKASVFTNLATVVSIIAGVVFLNESFVFNQLIGSAMILTGVFGTQYAGSKKKDINHKIRA